MAEEKLAKRLGWFAGLWLLGVLSVGAVAMVIKLSLGA